MRNYFTFVRDYLRRNGIKTDKESVKDYVKFPKNIEEDRSPLTIEKVKEIIEISDKKYIAFFLSLLSSGMRVGEFINCKVSWTDLEFYKNNGNLLIHIPGKFTKGQRDRYTFFSTQASKLLEPYIKNRINDNVLLDITYEAAQEYMSWIREKLGFNERYQSGFHKITIHTFRSYADTILTDHTNEKFAAYLLGHKRGLRYYRKTPEEALKLYKQAEPYLIVFSPNVM